MYIKEKWPNSNFNAKVGSNFTEYKINTHIFAQDFQNLAQWVKILQIWSHWWWAWARGEGVVIQVTFILAKHPFTKLTF